MKNMTAVFVVLALCSFSFAVTPSATKIDKQKEAAAATAQKALASAQVGRNSTSTCSFTFTSGTNNTYLKYCVTVNGNITQLMTPLGHEHIAVGSFGEGYGICDANTNVNYDDYADFGETFNWGTPVTTHPNATTVKVVRSTSDGIWTLTQTITQVAASSSVKIAMALKNNTAISRRAFLVRYADVDANGAFLNNFDATLNSSWGENGIFNFGLQLQNVGNPPASNGWVSISQNTPGGPTPCNFYANQVGQEVGVDGSIAILFDNTFAAHAMKTYTVQYKGL